jgi:hypothetical protein
MKRYCLLQTLMIIALIIQYGCQQSQSPENNLQHEEIGDNKQAGKSRNEMTGLAFRYLNEPNEAAFSILIPAGWQAEGGIFRINAATAGGPLNAIEAKCNLKYKKDSKGTVYFHILPDIVYGHTSIGGGFFPVGHNYQGAIIRPIVDAPTMVRSLFSELHPGASEVKILKIKRLPGEKESLDRASAYTNQLLIQIGLQSALNQNDAAGAVFEYVENGTRYREAIVTGLVNMPSALTWKNTRSIAFRAPANQFDTWRPVMDIMRFSIRFNTNWILKEAGGQRERADFVRKVYDEVRRIDQEIINRTTINREEIMNDNFLVLTGQEEYVNPHTNEIETGTDAYKYRWETSGGDVYYTDNEDENPNLFFNNTDFKRTPVRKRRNE